MTWLVVAAMLAGADPIEADDVLRGGTLHDSSGKPGIVGDLATSDDDAFGSLAITEG